MIVEYLIASQKRIKGENTTLPTQSKQKKDKKLGQHKNYELDQMLQKV
jgi:hypothetical protein